MHKNMCGSRKHRPIDYSKPVDKKGDWERGIEGMAKLGRIGLDYGIQ